MHQKAPASGCRLLAQSGHRLSADKCLLVGGKADIKRHKADSGQPLRTDPDIRVYALGGSQKFYAHAVVLPPNETARPEGTSAIERQVKPIRKGWRRRGQDTGAGNG